MSKKRKNIKNEITLLDRVKALFGRSIIQQKHKVQSNKKIYKRDKNKSWEDSY